MTAARRTRLLRARRRPAWAAPALILLLLAFAALGFAPEDVLADIGDAMRPGGAAVAADGIAVVDGDTIRVGAERIRIENIDTPELGDGAECLAERRLADRALAHAGELFAAASEVRIARAGEDRYGRTLARVSLDGRDFGRLMIEAGYAEPWRGRRVDWCGVG